MDERPCIRGCVYQGRHVHTCPEATGAARLSRAIFGGSAVECTGCEPVPAAHGAMICDRDVRALRRVIGDAPDLCQHLRSLIDPMRAQTYDREKLGGKPPSESQPPMSADIVDAADEVLGILAYWAEYFGDEMDYRGRRAFPAGVDSEDAYYLANTPTCYLLAHLDEVVNDSFVRLMAEKVLGPTSDPDEWTIAKVLRRWPMTERAKWSPKPCPGCEMRTVQVRPPRRASDEREYVCKNQLCDWRMPEEERVQWMEYFEGVAAA